MNGITRIWKAVIRIISMINNRQINILFALIGLLLAMGVCSAIGADGTVILDSDATVSVLNRSARVQADGTWQIDNVPANFGPVRVRATSVKNGITSSGQSDFITLQSNVVNGFSSFPLGDVTQIPSKLTLTAASTSLSGIGATSQVDVIATYPDASTKDLTATTLGTSYTVSNPAVASVNSNGLVTAISSGVVLVSALNEGAIGIVKLTVVLSGVDSDGDRIPDDIEIANGMNPNDPTDAKEDPDRDGLTNYEELMVYGTNRLVADTDGDGISDGDEVHGKLGKVTNPGSKDTDGDGINDLLEFQIGTDPTDKNSFSFGAALQSITVSPSRFVLTVNSIVGEASRRSSLRRQIEPKTSGLDS